MNNPISTFSSANLPLLHRFLQSSSSNLNIYEKAAMNQHCIASIACLLSSMKLLGQNRQDIFQVVVRGVYGLQLYATEYWTEYLSAIVDRCGGLDGDSIICNLLYRLSAGIDAAFGNDDQDLQYDELSPDKSWDHLKEHQGIYKLVRRAIWARSLKQLEQNLRTESCQ